MTQAQRRLRLSLLVTCVLLSVVFFQTSYRWTDGNPTFPTDDAYIYFQYARQLVEGHPFEYNTGDEPTTGMTSILYWLLLSAGYAVGFRGDLMVVFAFILGFAGLSVSAWLVYRITERLIGHAAGVAAAFLFCLNGQVVWGFFAGLEIPFFTSILLFSIYSFIKDVKERRFRATMIACGLLSLSRPEGLVVGCFMALLLVAANFRRESVDEEVLPRKRVFWVALPFLTSLSYLILNKAVAGHLSPTTASTKSMWNYPDLYKIFYAGTQFVLDSMRGLFGASYPSTADVGFSGSSTVAYFAPFALFFFILGSFTALTAELRKKEVRGFTLLLAVFAMGVGFAAFTSSSGFQHHRYLIPFYPLFIVCMIAGIFRFSAWAGRNLREWSVRTGLVAYFVLLTCFGLVNSHAQYTFESVMIRTTTTVPAEWVRDNLGDNEILGIVDAGILKYFGERKTVDLLGLTTRRFFARWMTGWGAVVEELSHMPDSERPTHMAMMPAFAKLSRGIEPLYAVIGEKVHEPLPLYVPGQTVFRTDFSGVERGSLPIYDAEGWVLVDSLDIGYMADEERCTYSTLIDLPAIRFDVGLHSTSYGEEPEIADGGRVILEGERFRVRTLPGRTLRIVLRSTRSFRTYRYSPVTDGYVDSSVQEFNPVTVFVDGRKLGGAGISTPSGDRWHETVLEVPSEFVTRERTTIEIMGSYNSFHYWFYQEER